MSQFSQRLIFREKEVLLQDSNGRCIKTFQKSDFLTREGHYKVTESHLGEFSEGLLIEINAPIEVFLTFKAEINANVKGAIANANAPGAIANANEAGSIANANVKGAIANANAPGAIANANEAGSIANANSKGATANANEAISIANAKVPGAIANH